MRCTLCNTELTIKKDDFYFNCINCGGVLKNNKYYLSKDQEKERYKEHNNDVTDEGYINFTAPITTAILKKQSPLHLGLDYGSGTGPVISSQLIDRGYKVKLFDPFFKNTQDYLNYKYDYIFSCEVFEHFFNPKKEIEKLIQLLKPNGHLYVMTHLYSENIDFSNWYYRNDPTHVFIYTRKTIDFIVKTYNLNLEMLENRLIVLRKN
ncbi:MAG: 2-polyprenyl-3-methyl-5-hydroxy-6-metoxy-1,4-benzoquinol methylase [Aequorivita sp.]|nr:2-polyprenyl-3-methyl-5-hydroxy-6-metoxy-1,4-benzoquinol methylase [Aequorivita sp.]|tara:strand:- start:6891 stop:7511 length:621 start_codon:yes stop_codon:yes gene_type:complete